MIRPRLRSTLFPCTTLSDLLEARLVSGEELGLVFRYVLRPRWVGGGEARIQRGQIGRAHVELQSPMYLVCRLLLEKKNSFSASPGCTSGSGAISFSGSSLDS